MRSNGIFGAFQHFHVFFPLDPREDRLVSNRCLFHAKNSAGGEVEGGVEIATKKKKRDDEQPRGGRPTKKKRNLREGGVESNRGGREKARWTGRGSVITRRTREPRRRTGLEPSLVGVCATRKYRERKKKRRSQTETQVIAYASSSDCPFLIFPRRGVAKPKTPPPPPPGSRL